MTTRFDIQDAEQTYINHIAEHNARRNLDGSSQSCRIGDGCKERIRLWKAWAGGPGSAAHRWGLDANDETRQERQFWERLPNATRFPRHKSSLKKVA